MRLAQIATILAPHENSNPDALQSVLRGPLLLTLLESKPGKGRTSPSEYEPAEIARARLLLAARDCGLSGTELGVVNTALNQPPAFMGKHSDWAKQGGAIVYPSALHSIIRGTQAGEEWIIRIRFTRGSDGKRHIKPTIFWKDGDTASDRGKVDLLTNETHLGTLVCPAADLIRPVIAYLGQTE
ncbi:MAG: hypothetical protein U1E06_19830 [Tabrizicola sp.]|uniref:hypothetical protein n=1 Tax=Tabrizicola sp. TaxID=2005166 RepID=UPI002736B1E6|nr:hypothetical protein [Tabrizicola sp.]MDP3263472.1 hypothetical protein [Tabrizicola sp.]MDP3646829.1 hypothetical protein [Paracoccaceae bacterium]MDZ4069057.1 hypothetical protein [Tabrizicola sp.]